MDAGMCREEVMGNPREPGVPQPPRGPDPAHSLILDFSPPGPRDSAFLLLELPGLRHFVAAALGTNKSGLSEPHEAQSSLTASKGPFLARIL